MLGRPGSPCNWRRSAGGYPRLSVAVGTALRVAIGVQQRFQAGAGLPRQTVSNAGIEPILMGMDRRAHDPLDTVRRRRFGHQLTAACLQPRHQVIGNRADNRRLIAEPMFDRLGVGDGRFAITEQGADLGAMAFPRASGQIVAVMRSGLHADLPRHSVDRLRLDFGRRVGEATVCTVEQE